MDVLLRLAQRAANLNPNEILNAVLANKELQEKILDLNRYGQLFDKGINSEGKRLSDIGGSYSPVTLDISIAKGRPKKSANHIDLHDTGEFYDSFYITLGEDSFEIEANPIKDDTNLLTEWGDEILGLTDESLDILAGWVREELYPALIEYLLAA